MTSSDDADVLWFVGTPAGWTSSERATPPEPVVQIASWPVEWLRPVLVYFEGDASVVQSDDGEAWYQCAREGQAWVAVMARVGMCPESYATGLPAAPPA